MSLLKATRSVFGLYSLTQVQGWGSGGTRGLDPDSVSLAQPASAAGRRRLPVAHAAEGEMVAIPVLVVSQGPRENLSPQGHGKGIWG